MRRSFLSEYIIFLRWCLHPTGNIPACTSTINWQELLAFAKKQTIVGIYWQGIQRLGDIPNKPSEDDVMDWMGAYTMVKTEDIHPPKTGISVHFCVLSLMAMQK